MKKTFAVLISLTHLAFVTPQTTGEEEFPGKITCYSFIGNGYTNNTQCPGSRVCCQTADLCSPNRFCLANDQIVVPTCSIFPWDETCSNICQYDPGTGFLPRAVECTDGSYCCDNDPPCCNENRGIVLNGVGGVVSTNSPTPTPSSTATSTTFSQTPAATTSYTPPTISSTPSSNSLSTGAIVGIAIGGVALLVTVAGMAYLVLRYRRQARDRVPTAQQDFKPLPRKPLPPQKAELPADTSSRYEINGDAVAWSPSRARAERVPAVEMPG